MIFLDTMGCTSFRSNSLAVQDQQSLVSTVAELKESTNPLFMIEASTVKGLDNARVLHFYDEKHGWVSDGTVLYKTDDGGKVWTKTEIVVPPGAEVRQILFVNPFVGWVVLQKVSDLIIDNPDFKGWLLFTSDGGQSWSTQYEELRVSGLRIAFSDELNGWLSGIKYIGSGVTYTYVARRTSDQGKNWLDVSDGLAHPGSGNKDAFRDAHNDGLMEIVPAGPLGAVGITARSSVVKTSDGGKVWQQIANLRQSPDSAVIKRFGQTGNKLWMVTGADGIEGVGADLTVEAMPNSWIAHTVPGAFFADALSLSKDEFVTCGYFKYPDKSKNLQDGAVFYSADGGQRWTFAYRSNKVKRINMLALAGTDNIWAAANDGMLLHMKRQ